MVASQNGKLFWVECYRAPYWDQYFFLIYINDLDCGITNWILKFADDTKIFGTSRDIHQLRKLQKRSKLGTCEFESDVPIRFESDGPFRKFWIAAPATFAVVP